MANSNPAVLGSLMPGANLSGSSVAVPPLPSSIGAQAIGGNTNPFLPQPMTANAVAPSTNVTGMTAAPMPANTGGVATSGTGTSNPTVAGLPQFAPGSSEANAVWRGLMSQGIPAGIAGLISQFLGSGAGYNSGVANALIAQLQPSIERGTENIAEQFSAIGNRFGSPAAVGMGDYMSQVNLNIGELLSNLYESSVQNYLSVLMGVNKPKQQSPGPLGMLSQLLGPISGAAGAASAAGVGGTAGSILDVIAGLG